MADWTHVEIDVDEETAESVGAALIDEGAAGIEERAAGDGVVTVVAYFASPPDVDTLAAALVATPGVEQSRRSALRVGATPERDWLELWKAGFEPVPIGERLLVVPSWRRDEATRFPDRIAIEVDPGMAFGTGTHETTRLCLEWLDEEWRGGSMLDVGTGTGILAIAARLLAPESLVVGVDVDPIAIDVARENATINGVEETLRLEVATPEAVDGSFEVVVANLTADVIILERDNLTARVSGAGTLVVSGVLDVQEGDVVASLAEVGFRATTRGARGEWVRVAFERIRVER